MNKHRIKGEEKEIDLGTLDPTLSAYTKHPHVREAFKYALDQILRRTPKAAHLTATSKVIEVLEYVDTFEPTVQ